MNLPNKLIIGIIITVIALVGMYLALRSYSNPEALGGFSSNPEPTRITISNTTLDVPQNIIRFNNQRNSAQLSKLDLFIQWPSMKGFTHESASKFQNIKGTDRLVFITLEAGEKLNPPSQKLEGLYRRFFTKSPWRGPAGLIGNELNSSSGYLSEDVFYANGNDDLFLTRCLRETSTGQDNLLPTCIYEFTLDEGVNVFVRFHRSLLPEWQAIEEKIQRLMLTLKTSN